MYQKLYGTCSVEQRSVIDGVNSTTNWTVLATVPATTDLLYVLTVSINSEYDQLQHRVVCNWLDVGKEQPGRPSPPSALLKPATFCIGNSLHIPAGVSLLLGVS